MNAIATIAIATHYSCFTDKFLEKIEADFESETMTQCSICGGWRDNDEVEDFDINGEIVHACTDCAKTEIGQCEKCYEYFRKAIKGEEPVCGGCETQEVNNHQRNYY